MTKSIDSDDTDVSKIPISPRRDVSSMKVISVSASTSFFLLTSTTEID